MWDSSTHPILWITVMLSLSWLTQRVLLLETTCGTKCRDAQEFNGQHYSSLSLNCNSSSATAIFDTITNEYYYDIEEIYLECSYQSSNHCTPAFEYLWGWTWSTYQFKQTFDLNTSLLQECKLVGCFSHGSLSYPFQITPSTCNISGFIFEFEKSTDFVMEGENKSICVRCYGKTGITTDVSVVVVNRSNSTLGSQNYYVEQNILSFSMNSTNDHQCIHMQVFEDDEIENKEVITFHLEILKQAETAMLGQNSTLTMTIIDNDVEVTPDHSEYTVDEGEIEVCISTHGHREFQIMFPTKGLPGIQESCRQTTENQFCSTLIQQNSSDFNSAVSDCQSSCISSACVEALRRYGCCLNGPSLPCNISECAILTAHAPTSNLTPPLPLAFFSVMMYHINRI